MNPIELSLLSAIGILVSAVALGLFAARQSSAPMRWGGFFSAAGVGAVVTSLAWVVGLTGVPAAFLAPLIALGAFFATAVSVRPRMAAVGILRVNAFSALVTALVFVPSAILVWALWYDPMATGIGFVDLGAALPTEVAVGAAIFAVMLVERRRPLRLSAAGSGWSVLWPTLVMWVGWVGWLVGLELSIDRLTPTILANILLMPMAGALAVSVVERARHRTNSFTGVAFGILAGCAAATPSAGYVIPAIGVLIALIAGGLCALLPRNPLARIAGTLLVAGGSSLILLGLLAQDVSFIYTGQPELLISQLITVVVSATVGFTVGFFAWLLLRPSR